MDKPETNETGYIESGEGKKYVCFGRHREDGNGVDEVGSDFSEYTFFYSSDS